MAPKAEGQSVEVLSLPDVLVSRVDATRMAREVETLGSTIEQHNRHNRGSETVHLSDGLHAMVEINQLNLNQAEDRDRLYSFLKELKKDAPSIHMSFAAEPSSQFTTKLITWLRSEVHPLIMLEIGLQPTIAAGCTIRTRSKYFDCSIRQHLLQNKPKLVELMKGMQHA